MRAFGDDRDAGIEVGDQQDPPGPAADLGQPPDEAAAGDRRLATRQPLIAARVDHDGADIAAARVADHAGGDIGDRTVRHDLQ